MIDEYVRDPAELAAALTSAHAAVPLLANAALAMTGKITTTDGASDNPNASPS